MAEPIRLGVNVDHVATIRNARGGVYPDPVEAALLAIKAGADSITAHLREDRRHIRDNDVFRLKDSLEAPLNLEMAATEEMQKIALDLLPQACCLVPEKRQEVTTEGGLSVAGNEADLQNFIAPLQEAGIRVSFFIDALEDEINAAREVGADAVELHTGPYVEATDAAREVHLERLRTSAARVSRLGMECHAGHGLNFDTVEAVAAIPQIVELNIGHFLVGASVFYGMDGAVERMRALMTQSRDSV
ncbi:MAG: pyridoxine 5'-phosphate synthase [Alphaproteobacteria bacterium]|nr:pyridoxine 5'-phosphate synthase [Alphaproteobacteria bacterium]